MKIFPLACGRSNIHRPGDKRKTLSRWLKGVLDRTEEKQNLGIQSKSLCHVAVDQFKLDMEKARATDEQKKDKIYVITYYERKFQTRLDGVNIIGEGLLMR